MLLLPRRCEAGEDRFDRRDQRQWRRQRPETAALSGVESTRHLLDGLPIAVESSEEGRHDVRGASEVECEQALEDGDHVGDL